MPSTLRARCWSARGFRPCGLRPMTRISVRQPRLRGCPSSEPDPQPIVRVGLPSGRRDADAGLTEVRGPAARRRPRPRRFRGPLESSQAPAVTLVAVDMRPGVLAHKEDKKYLDTAR